jgi:enoyl-CoA hydratase
MNFKYFIIEEKEGICLVKINNPDSMNALSVEVSKEFAELINYIEDRDDIFTVIITGEGKAFVAGGDLKAMSTMNPEEAMKLVKILSNVFIKMESMPKVFIAAVNGVALGGGCELAMACDLRIASTKAKFGQPEVAFGILPGATGTKRLPMLVGIGKARELIYTGEPISAEEACSIGLVNKVVQPEELLDKSFEMAGKIMKNGLKAVGYSKIAINKEYHMDMNSAVELENRFWGLCFATEDQKEGMKAFVEKRKPNFKNK